MTPTRRKRFWGTRVRGPTTLLAAMLVGGMPLAAQSGDRPGEKQMPIVPAERIPPAPALSPNEALATFQLAPGIRLEIAAAEPLVQEPVAITFGPDGAMWVVEMRGFMHDVDGTGEDAPIGRVSVLRDTNDDGRFDQATVFLDGLVMPRAIALVGDGALIGAPPELAFWRDTNGDGRADEKTVVASDFGVQGDPARPNLAGPERAPNSLLWGFDNWLHSAGYVRKLRRAGSGWETAPIRFCGQWGLSHDDFGRQYFNYNSDYLRADVIPADYLRRNPHFPRLAGTNVKIADDQSVWPARVTPGINRGYMEEMLRDGRLKTFTATGAPWVYRGDLFPEFYGNVFVTEPAGNLVRRAVVNSANGTLEARNAYERAEFVASTDERFRPVNFSTGPDGALYIVDLYRGILQHRMSFTTYLREQVKARGLERPLHLGRIYRVVPAEGPVPRGRRFDSRDTAALVGYLSHPNSWFRETAQRLLVERRDPAAVAILNGIVRSAPQAAARVHALWTLEGIDALAFETVNRALGDEAAMVKVAALRLAERFLATPRRGELRQQFLALARDPVPEVQLQAVLSIGKLAEPEIDVQVAGIVRTSTGNRFLKDAFLSGLRDREWPLLLRLLRESPSDDAGMALAGDLASGILASRNVGKVTQLFDSMAQQSVAPRLLRSLLAGLAAASPGLARRPLVLPAAPAGWEAWRAEEANRSVLATIGRGLAWPGRDHPALAAARPLSGEEQQRFEAGRTLYAATCASCHQESGAGLAGLAPPLLDSEWVLGPAERLIRIALHGVRGPIVVLGETHTGDMPGFGLLSDEQLSAILTYVRRAWGHSGAPISPEEVADLRRRTEGRTDAWSARELLRIQY